MDYWACAFQLQICANSISDFVNSVFYRFNFFSIALKHDDVRDHNKPGARCIAGELRGPAVKADGKQAVRNALAVVY